MSATAVFPVVVMPFPLAQERAAPMDLALLADEAQGDEVGAAGGAPLPSLTPQRHTLSSLAHSPQVFETTATTTANGGRIFKLSARLLERVARRLILKVPAEEVDVSKVRSHGTLELVAGGLKRRQRCLGGVKALMASLKAAKKPNTNEAAGSEAPADL